MVMQYDFAGLNFHEFEMASMKKRVAESHKFFLVAISNKWKFNPAKEFAITITFYFYYIPLLFKYIYSLIMAFEKIFP